MRKTMDYLPLPFQAGETNVPLSLTVQRARLAEFLVRVPKRPKDFPQLETDSAEK